jgi:hypothetical protein
MIELPRRRGKRADAGTLASVDAGGGLASPELRTPEVIAAAGDGTATVVVAPGPFDGGPLVLGAASPEFEPRAIAAQFRAVPYRPDVVADGWSADRFTVRAASVRGLMHRYRGIPRQDDFGIELLRSPDRLLVAVADGISSAPQSHLGATIAVRYALRWLAERVGASTAEIDWRELMQHSAWAIVEQASVLFPTEAPSPDAQFAESQLATTLVCAVLEFDEATRETRAHVSGVGDSGAWLMHEDRFDHVFGGKANPDGPVSSSAVSGLPKVPAELQHATVVVPPGTVLLLGTDGFGDPLGAGSGEVGRAFRNALLKPPPTLALAWLLDFSRETFDDDRTLVAVWPAPDSDPADGAATESGSGAV